MSNRTILPPALARWQGLPDLRRRTKFEYSSACPQCGGARGGSDPADRFRLFADDPARAWCRRCGYQAFADEGEAIDPQVAREAARIAQERRRQAQAQESARVEAFARRAHYRALARQGASRVGLRAWRGHGIEPWQVRAFRLGYTQNAVDLQGSPPALAIPYFEGAGRCINVQYRLLHDGAGKYRFTPGLPVPLYRPAPDVGPRGRTLVVEGAKKAIVAYGAIGYAFDAVVAVASKTPSGANLEALKGADELYVLLDPDADAQAQAIADRHGSAVVAKFGAKVDDYLLAGGDPAVVLHALRVRAYGYDQDGAHVTVVV